MTAFVAHGHVLDDDDIIPDGGSVRVPVHFMDAALSRAVEMFRHRDAAAMVREAYTDHKRWLADAWRTPATPPHINKKVMRRGGSRPTEFASDADDPRTSALEQRKRWLADAWRNA